MRSSQRCRTTWSSWTFIPSSAPVLGRFAQRRGCRHDPATSDHGGHLAIGALAWALGGEWVSISHHVPENHFIDLLGGLAFLASGIVALDRRPGNAIGLLLVAFGFIWYLRNWSALGIPGLADLGAVSGYLGPPLLVQITLAYPTGRLRALPVQADGLCPWRYARSNRRRRGDGHRRRPGLRRPRPGHRRDPRARPRHSSGGPHRGRPVRGRRIARGPLACARHGPDGIRLPAT